MAVFTIGDLHLSLGVQKPMDIFKGWENYTQKIEENWRKNVENGDTVVIVGDISWGMKLEDTFNDFAFLQSLPGEKILIKGNHDYWWQTKKKIDDFFEANDFNSLKILHNNCFAKEGIAICGTRSWLFEQGEQGDKIIKREMGRLRASLEQAQRENAKEKVVFLHYPPQSKLAVSKEMIDIMHEFEIKRCYYGHLHGASIYSAVQGNVDGIDYKLVSADAIDFCPVKV